jgi:predicted HTH transcriptional regulator
MIPKPINDISLSDLQALIGNVREGKTIEYKSDMPGRAATETGPFLAGVSSLANTSGGDFVLGIKEDAGLATAIPAIEFINLDAEKLRLELSGISAHETDWPG